MGVVVVNHVSLDGVMQGPARPDEDERLREPLPWANSHVVSGALADAVREIDARHGGLTVLGSGELIGSLMGQDLIDEWLLLIHPLVLGSGRRLFGAGVPARLALADSLVTGTGVVIATYRRA